MYKNVVRFLARNGFFAAVILLGLNLQSASGVNLAWNASTSANITGYTVRYGTASGSYPSTLNAGSLLTATISPLAAGTRYYFVVTARNSSGLESDPSLELSYTVPGVPLPNVLPTLNALSNVTITEDAAAQTVSLSGISAGLGDLLQILGVTATSSNPALIPNPTVNYTSPNTTGSLQFTPVANATGTATITVTVNDFQLLNNLVSRTFVVTVNPVNDAPTLNPIGNLSLGISAPAQTVSLSGIGTGAANESQALVVTASSSNPSLIPNPAISYSSPGTSGTLSFTPVAGATGTATVTVNVNDGQSQNGTTTRTFTVTASTTTKQTFFVEAESAARTSPMTTSANANALNGQCIYSTTANQGTVSIPINVSQPGDYFVWGRVLSPDNSMDSFFIKMDAGAEEIYNTAPNSWSSVWQWTKFSLSGVPRAYTLSAGAHTLVLRCREASTFLDALYITNDPQFVPPAGGTTTPNVAPTLATIGNLTINEDAAQQTVNLAGIGTGSASETQTLTVTATSSNPSLIPNPTVTYTSPNATGTLRFTPVAQASGTATITVSVNDGQSQNNVTSRSFTVTVNAVNDAPTLNTLGNLALALNAPRQTISLAGIGSGAANESQTLTVTANSSNTGIIPTPTISYASPGATGSLSFTPVANVTGTATITVTVNDGQSQNNLATRSFTVSVSSVNNAPTLNTLSNLSLTINAARRTISLSGISSGAANENQTLTVTASSSNTGLIPTPTITYTSPGTTGSLAFTPVSNATGTATITVTVNDGQALNNLVTRSFTVTVTGTPSSSQTLFVEAESGTRSGSMVSASDSLASGGKYVYPNSYDAGAVTFNFSAVSAGDYWVWCRVLSPNNSRDSFFVSMDGGANDIYNTSPNSWSSAWQWTRVNASGTTRVYKLTAGSHTLKFSNREKDTQLDALYITNDRNFVPTSGGGAILAAAAATEPEPTQPVTEDSAAPVVSQLEVIRSDARTITLGWRTDEPAVCRVHYGTALPLTEHSQAETTHATEHIVSLPRLQPGARYLIQIQSTDIAGNISLNEISQAKTPSRINIAWEADEGVLSSPMEIESSAHAVGGVCISSAVNNSGSVMFPIEIGFTSDYALWCRVLRPENSLGSFLLNPDNGDTSIFPEAGVAEPNGNRWHWVRASNEPLLLSAGLHEITLHALQAGLRLDELILSNDPEFLPEE